MAKARSGPGKKRSTKSKEPAPATESPGSNARELDGDDSILVVQFSEPDPLPPVDIETFVAEVIGGALATTKTRPKGDGTWQFFLATERPHPAAQHCWLGFGAGTPAKIVDAVQAGLEAHGCVCGREYAVIAHHALDRCSCSRPTASRSRSVRHLRATRRSVALQLKSPASRSSSVSLTSSRRIYSDRFCSARSDRSAFATSKKTRSRRFGSAASIFKCSRAMGTGRSQQ